jgi:peroxiredoxin
MAISTPPPDLGKMCPDFLLPGVDGTTYTNHSFDSSHALLVVFTCNHCPYANAVEDRILALAHHFGPSALGVVAICSNDAQTYPDDSFDNLARRWREKAYPFPYLHDDTQAVAKAFDAVCTPDFFLFDRDRRLVYRGRLDDNWKEPSKVTQEELKAAVQAVLDNRQPTTDQKPAMGCGIKWRAA